MVLYLLLCAQALSMQDTMVVSLADAQRRVLDSSPAFLAERQATAIARGALKQARVYPFNPEVSFNIPGASRDPLDNDDYQASLFQEIEFAGQRGLRIRAARTGLSRTEHVVRDGARLAVLEVSTAFFRAVAVERRLRLAEDVLSLNTRLLDAVRTQLQEGEISALDGNLAEIEFGRARARVLAVRRERTAAMLELKRLLGIEAEQEIRLLDPTPSMPESGTLHADSLMRQARISRPDLIARQSAVREIELRERLIRREVMPNVRIGALAERDREGGTPRIGFGLGVTVPLFARNQGKIEQQQAQKQRAMFELHAIELQVKTEVATAVHQYRLASEEATIFEASILEPARKNSALLETAYRAGKLALPTLLLLRNQLLDTELGYLESWLGKQEAWIRLQSAIGALPIGQALERQTSLEKLRS